MPLSMDKAKIVRQATAVIDLGLGGTEEVNFTFRVPTREESREAKRFGEAEDMEAATAMLADLVQSWDILIDADDPASVAPITVETLDALGDPIIAALYAAMIEANVEAGKPKSAS